MRDSFDGIGGRHRPAGRNGSRWTRVLLALVILASLAAVARFGFGIGGGPATSAIGASPNGLMTGDPPGRASAAPSGLASSALVSPASRPLAGKVIGIDPGHNGRNSADPAFMTKQIWNGRSLENCDTTGAQTASGYTEAQFNFNVAMYLRADLIRDGARVVMTRNSNDGEGPCVDQRAAILNQAGASVSIDIHGDGGPVTGRGFTVLEPVADGPNNGVIASSLAFGADVHAAMLARTPFGVSDYYSGGGYWLREDLAGLNLTTMPKVLIECGNMANPQDASLMTDPKVQREIAAALEAAIIKFLTGSWPAS